MSEDKRVSIKEQLDRMNRIAAKLPTHTARIIPASNVCVKKMHGETKGVIKDGVMTIEFPYYVSCWGDGPQGRQLKFGTIEPYRDDCPPDNDCQWIIKIVAKVIVKSGRTIAEGLTDFLFGGFSGVSEVQEYFLMLINELTFRFTTFAEEDQSDPDMWGQEITEDVMDWGEFARDAIVTLHYVKQEGNDND